MSNNYKLPGADTNAPVLMATTEINGVHTPLFADSGSGLPYGAVRQDITYCDPGKTNPQYIFFKRTTDPDNTEDNIIRVRRIDYEGDPGSTPNAPVAAVVDLTFAQWN